MSESFHTRSKAKALGKDEVMLLLELISKNKNIMSKATNASSNKLKEEAWKEISDNIIAMTGEMRRPDQLRLKWDNLKKSARKRLALIRQNNLQSDGEKAYIPPDVILDQVASILIASGYTVEAGDNPEVIPVMTENVSIDFDPLLDHVKLEVGSSTEEQEISTNSFQFRNTNSKINNAKKLRDKLIGVKIRKEKALAEYFEAKAEKVQLEVIKLQLEVEKLRNS